MLRYNPEALTALSLASLKTHEDAVAAKATRAEKIDEAGRLFKRKTPKSAFDEVKAKLRAVSPPGRACFYCERDRYRDIDHIRPKRHYPEQCFHWANYVFACAICNQDAKGDRYAVFGVGDQIIEFNRQWPKSDPPPVGDPVPIDPRAEDPLDHIKLDLLTGIPTPIELANRSYSRARYTIDLFKLDADDLTRIRRQAFASFVQYLELFAEALEAADAARAARVLRELTELPYPTVLVEMRRQAEDFPRLAELFNLVPPQVGSRP